jgi:hypothetical protein
LAQEAEAGHVLQTGKQNKKEETEETGESRPPSSHWLNLILKKRTNHFWHSAKNIAKNTTEPEPSFHSLNLVPSGL